MTDILKKIESEAIYSREFGGSDQYDAPILLALLKIVRIQREALIEAIDMHRTNMVLTGSSVSILSCYEEALLESDKILKDLE